MKLKNEYLGGIVIALALILAGLLLDRSDLSYPKPAPELAPVALGLYITVLLARGKGGGVVVSVLIGIFLAAMTAEQSVLRVSAWFHSAVLTITSGIKGPLNAWIGTTIVFTGWLISLCFHEFAHALVAFRGGDRSVGEKGYLTLNPLRYTHTQLTIVFPLLFLVLGDIALPGAAVYINHSNLRNRVWDSLVSLAGPVANLLILLALAFCFNFGAEIDAPDWLWSSLALLAWLETAAIILNMLPIPGLDGFGVIKPWLSPEARRAANDFGQYGIWVLFAVLWIDESLSNHLWSIVYAIDAKLEVPRYGAQNAFDVFQKQSPFLLAPIILVAVLAKGSLTKKQTRPERISASYNSSIEREFKNVFFNRTPADRERVVSFWMKRCSCSRSYAHGDK